MRKTNQEFTKCYKGAYFVRFYCVSFPFLYLNDGVMLPLCTACYIVSMDYLCMNTMRHLCTRNNAKRV